MVYFVEKKLFFLIYLSLSKLIILPLNFKMLSVFKIKFSFDWKNTNTYLFYHIFSTSIKGYDKKRIERTHRASLKENQL